MSSVFISLATIFILRFLIIVYGYNQDATSFLQNEKVVFYWMSLTISVVITAIFYTVYYIKSKQETKVKEQKVIAGTASAKFDALKNQLDPHFLFNSLNVLTSLIEENPDKAQQFTTSLLLVTTLCFTAFSNSNCNESGTTLLSGFCACSGISKIILSSNLFFNKEKH